MYHCHDIEENLFTITMESGICIVCNFNLVCVVAHLACGLFYPLPVNMVGQAGF